jgi:REP element-mobilizing transposase RayT
MPRPRRSLPDGSSFHITLRCNSRQFLIAKSLRRDVLLAVLAKAQAKIPHRLYAVCLMANHLHLLIRPDDASQLPRLMHWIGWYSAMALNRLAGRPIPTTGTTAGWNVMASVNGIQVFCKWHQRSKDAPSVMSVSASSIAITAKDLPSATGAQGCLSDWLRPVEATEARANEYHQGNSNYLLLLIYA